MTSFSNDYTLSRKREKSRGREAKNAKWSKFHGDFYHGHFAVSLEGVEGGAMQHADDHLGEQNLP